MKKKINIKKNSPNVSEASQFHHPPQELSCAAHQLPIVNIIIVVEKKIKIVIIRFSNKYSFLK
jgi:hypothetical protein